MRDAAGAPIFVSNRDRWIGAAVVPTGCADECAVAELKNVVICSGFTEVLVRSDNEPVILAPKESAATALKLTGVNVKMEESSLYDSQSNELAESAVKDVFMIPGVTKGVPRVPCTMLMHSATSDAALATPGSEHCVPTGRVLFFSVCCGWGCRRHRLFHKLAFLDIFRNWLELPPSSTGHTPALWVHRRHLQELFTFNVSSRA